VVKIRQIVQDHSHEEMGEAEIERIEATMSENELEHWTALKLYVDADDEDSKGILTKDEVLALCDLMDEDVALMLQKEKDLDAQRALMEYSPERKETIKVQEQLSSLEKKLEAMLGAGTTSTPAI
jgi:hypothetical protein